MWLPRISVIVPSFNQGEYLEETLLSILSQGYENLELIVIDGGSTDNSVEIIRKYENEITYWVSEKDRGQSHAINKGLQKATGEWVAWMNSDDCYLPGALQYIFGTLPHEDYDFLYGNCHIGETIACSREYAFPEANRKNLRDIILFFYNLGHIIPSQSVFIRRSLLDEVGLLDEELHYCMDLDWYCRIYLATDRRLFYDKSICFFRTNEFTKTGSGKEKMNAEAIELAIRYSKHLKSRDRKKLLQTIKYHEGLRDMFGKDPHFGDLFGTFLKAPVRAFEDRRFWGLLKKRATGKH